MPDPGYTIDPVTGAVIPTNPGDPFGMTVNNSGPAPASQPAFPPPQMQMGSSFLSGFGASPAVPMYRPAKGPGRTPTGAPPPQLPQTPAQADSTDPGGLNAAFGPPPQPGAPSNMFRGGGYGGGRSHYTANPAANPVAPLAIDNPENALTAAFTGGYTKPPPNPENAFTAAFTGGPTAVDQQHMPWPGGPTVNPTTQYRQPQSVNLGYGVPGVRPPPVQGPIAALAPPQQGPRFTTVPRPNADPGTGGGMLGGVSGPANIGSGYGGARGGGGAPLGTALDLSGLFQHPQPAAAATARAPVQIPRTPATQYRTPATQAGPTNFAGQGPYHGTQGPIGKPVAGSFGGSGIVYGPNGTQILNPGRALFGGGPAS